MSENHADQPEETQASDAHGPDEGQPTTPGEMPAEQSPATAEQRTTLSELVPLHVPAWLLTYIVVAVGGAATLVFAGDTVVGSTGTFVLGAVLLLLGGQLLVDGSISLARAIGVPQLLIGMTIVAIGTSAPELAFNIVAAIDYQTELSLGNVVGSNITNIALVLGIAAIVRPLIVQSRLILIEMPILIAVTGGIIALAFVSKVQFGDATMRGFSFWEGVAMTAGFLALLGFWYNLGKRDARDPLSREVAEAMEEPPLKISIALLYVAGGLGGLLFGGHLAKTAASDIAATLGMSETMIGLTIVAFATSLPEAVTSIIACRRGHADLAIGNIVGSNLFNLLLVLGVTCMITPVPLVSNDNIWDLIVMGALTLILLPISITGQRRITRPEGIFLLLCYVIYIAYTIVRER